MTSSAGAGGCCAATSGWGIATITAAAAHTATRAAADAREMNAGTGTAPAYPSVPPGALSDFDERHTVRPAAGHGEIAVLRGHHVADDDAAGGDDPALEG